MFAQTKRLKELGFQGEGGGSQASFPLVVPLVPFRRCGKERKKEIKLTQYIRLTQILN